MVILNHSLWQNRFRAGPQTVGRTPSAPSSPGFQFPIEAEPVEMWANVARDTEGAQAVSARRGNPYLDAVGQLKPRVTVAQADVELVSLASQLEREYPIDDHGFSVRVVLMLERLTGERSRSLWVMFAAAPLRRPRK